VPEGGEVSTTRQEGRELRAQERLVRTFQHTSDRLGGQNLKDIYAAFRFATDPEHPEATDLALGIFAELNFRERFFFARMMRFNRRFGRDAVMMAFTHHEVLKELQGERQPAPEN
jgi:hypothetical protein